MESQQIHKNIQDFRVKLPENVQLVAVSKTHPAEAVLSAFQAGQLDFGENRVQEMVAKWEILPKDIRWHQIGTLQKNKVKYIAPFVYLIHSVDSPDLLRTIQKEALKNQRTIQCLIQVHIAQEETKFGFSVEEARSFIQSFPTEEFSHVRITGLMGMASFTSDKSQIAKEFRLLKGLFDELRQGHPDFVTLSMGMSSDYEIAIAEGSNMVRVGSAIFGSRS
jgi:pyridoxal phosphate enzyme (YggS family)